MEINTSSSLITIARQYYIARNLDAAKLAIKEALHFAKQNNNDKEITLALFILGQIESTKGHYQQDKAIEIGGLNYLKEGLEHALKFNNIELEVDISIAIGKVYQNRQDYNEANKYYQNAFNKSKVEAYQIGLLNTQFAFAHLSILQNNLANALSLLEGIVEKIDEEKDIEHFVKAYQLLVLTYQRRDEAQKAASFANKIIQLKGQFQNIEAELTAYNGLAIYHCIKEEYREALDYFKIALSTSEQIGFRLNTYRILINIGTIYLQLFNHKEALIRYEQILHNYAEVIDTFSLNGLLFNIGELYLETDDYEKALDYFTECLRFSKKYNYKAITARTLNQLSWMYTKKELFDQALVYAREAEELFVQIGEVYGKQTNLGNLARIFYKLGDYDKALEYINAAIGMDKQDRISLARVHEIASNIYKIRKDFEKAFFHIQQYLELYKVISEDKKAKAIIDLEIKYRIYEKDKEIETVTKEKHLEIQTKNKELKQQQEKLAERNHELTLFTYAASHDLKEPLRMITLYSQMLTRRYKNQLDDNAQEYFGYMNEGVKRMIKLLENVREYASIGTQEHEHTIVNINQIVQEVSENLKLKIKQADAVIEFDNLPIIKTSYTLMIRLFQNLINNAIKFRNKQVQPVITITAKANHQYYTFCISDNGIGIEEAYHEKVFLTFKRLHHRGEYEGSGIGLAICKKVVEQLAGKIWIESEEGKGTKVFFTIQKIEKD